MGGIATGADVREKLDAGATVVQLYTGMVYRGPWIVRDLLNELKGERGDAGIRDD